MFFIIKCENFHIMLLIFNLYDFCSLIAIATLTRNTLWFKFLLFRRFGFTDNIIVVIYAIIIYIAMLKVHFIWIIHSEVSVFNGAIGQGMMKWDRWEVKWKRQPGNGMMKTMEKCCGVFLSFSAQFSYRCWSRVSACIVCWMSRIRVKLRLI